MPPLVCPHCRRSNPAAATYCYFDGMMLSGGGGAPNRLASAFVFPSGRNCNTFDELVQGCQEEWTTARAMLKQGVFQGFFTTSGRMDLVRAAQEATGQADPDIGLSQLLQAMPSSGAVKGPKLDINPRRLTLGKVNAGQTRKINFKVLNVGQGMLQGTLKIAEGNEWLKLAASGQDGQVAIKTSREQQIPMIADTRTLAAGEPYAAKLRVITNGGVEEIPIRMDVAGFPFAKPPFQGAKSPRDMAVKMRNDPKAAAALLESGELPKWFAKNGWTYPISGSPAPGVAGVQQFFEAMGLAKPPGLKLSHREIRLVCKVPDRPRAQLKLAATSKKYVYANVRCDAPWLNILTPSVAGPQQAGIMLEVDPRYLPRGRHAETAVQLVANGNRKIAVKVRVDIQRPADSMLRRVLQPIVVMGLFFFLLRLFLSPAVDLYARSSAVATAARQSVTAKAGQNGEGPVVERTSPSQSVAGWLQLPWLGIFMDWQPVFPEGFFSSQTEVQVNNESFRDAFVQSFVKIVVISTWWMGAVIGAFALFRKSGVTDGIWGLLSGAILGVIGSATVACMLLLVDLGPSTAFWIVFGGSTTGPVHLLMWIVVIVLWWTLVGAGLGFLLLILGPIGKVILNPIQDVFAGFFRLFGLRGLANFCASQ